MSIARIAAWGFILLGIATFGFATVEALNGHRGWAAFDFLLGAGEIGLGAFMIWKRL